MQLEEQPEPTVEAADCAVEAGDWAPRLPAPDGVLPERLAFLDGRRRLDARLIGRLDGQLLYAAFATLAVGAVVLDRPAKKATFADLEVTRVLAIGGGLDAPGQAIPCPLGGRDVLNYDTILRGPDNGPRVAIDLVQKAMLDAEAALADRLGGHDALVVRDGPLARPDPEGKVVGYIKTMHHQYLPADRAGILWALVPGQRTPLFYIRRAGTYSWYMRMGAEAHDPVRAGTHGLHGVVRVEVTAAIPTHQATHIADVATRLLPQYASQPHRDARAPQNLTPVGALERELGRRMGDPAIIARRIRRHLASMEAAT